MRTTASYIVLFVILLAGTAPLYAAEDAPDTIHLKDGTTIVGGRVIEELPTVLRYQTLDEYGAVSKIPVADIESIDYYDPPDEYSLGVGMTNVGKHREAYEYYEKALKAYNPEEQRAWVPMMCLYKMANAKKIMGMLDADPKLLAESAALYARLAQEHPASRLTLEAVYLQGVCEAAIAQFSDNAQEAARHRTEASLVFENLKKTATNLLAGEAQYEPKRRWWALRASIATLKTKIDTADAPKLRQLSEEFNALAKSAPQGEAVEYEARSGLVHCEFALAATENKRWDEAEKATRTLIEQIAATRQVSADDRAVLITRLYLLIGNRCLMRAEGVAKTDPLREVLLKRAAGAYLRPPLLYFANEQTAPEQARALFYGAEAMIRLGDTANAYRMLRTLKARYSNSEIWQKKIDKLLKTIV